MKLKASVDYGVRAIMYLAVQDRTCSSREISEEMSVPRDYLIQLALRLRNAGLIKARPGKSGGYSLAKSPGKISIGQILDAFDSDLKHVRQPMKDSKEATHSAREAQKMHGMVLESLDAYLTAITVQDLVDVMGDSTSTNAVLADALEREAARLRGN